MASQLTHAALQELLGAYAIDAVDSEEATLVEAHLADCPRCRHEVAEHREAATLLLFTGASAPDRVWSLIAAGLEDKLPPLAMPRQRPVRRRPMRLLAAAAAVAAVVISALSVQVVRQGHRVDRLAAISDHHGLGQAAVAALRLVLGAIRGFFRLRVAPRTVTERHARADGRRSGTR